MCGEVERCLDPSDPKVMLLTQELEMSSGIDTYGVQEQLQISSTDTDQLQQQTGTDQV